ncbi:hypothetical protein GCM10022243_48390 [Saccharothrix violaceirubra]|uniref:5-methylcytosine-specific restriction endonuclease McrA n=1 Tax=Saccharothrix violaceirubra TaxID=413306 RepID=A0A7W7SZG6_9PSEU|nr:hypothetical protein [Saccharothrix violaceirubra]MBB4963819.1 5-methylcytosine-specific restriction endonuclease McrA [Saccharothrix violaceirubra]
MPQRAGKRCPTPGCTNPTGPDGYCAERCARRRNAAAHRTTPTKVARASREVRRHRAEAVRAHLDQHDDGMGHCPGYGREPHDVFPGELTADDPVPIARGGDPLQQMAVLCRSCNSRKGAR